MGFCYFCYPYVRTDLLVLIAPRRKVATIRFRIGRFGREYPSSSAYVFVIDISTRFASYAFTRTRNPLHLVTKPPPPPPRRPLNRRRIPRHRRTTSPACSATIPLRGQAAGFAVQLARASFHFLHPPPPQPLIVQLSRAPLASPRLATPACHPLSGLLPVVAQVVIELRITYYPLPVTD